ncbi:MAG: response regulator, partial [Acidimicrobiia bacterium]|nr:response regulator [Acidimicrobiia bacterium]
TRGDAAMCRELQIAGYLTSPYAPEDVARAAHEVLAGPAPLDLTLLVTKHWLRERRRRLNLLVVDASPTIRMSANRMLEKRGHVVVTSGSGSEALAAASARKFDAAVVDLELPGTEGVDLIRQLKAAAEYELPIVASTVSSDTEAHVAAIHAGCSFVLARPFEINDLVTAIEESVKDE